MAILLRDLVKRIPSETESVVSRTRTRYNGAIRRILRVETGLRLSSGGGVDEEDRDVHTVKIRIVPGVPAELENLKFDDDKWLAILLAPWRSTLTSLRTSLGDTKTTLLPELLVRPDQSARFPDIGANIEVVQSFAEALLRDAAAFDLVKTIHAIEEDILGRYSFKLTDYTHQVADAGIELYWGVIGLIARAIGVTVEGLTVKVLAHELAHAYTHLGADIDGERWESRQFAGAERGLKEGLAQYYTSRIVERMRGQIPDAEKAYATLLPHQPDDYRAHNAWIDANRTPEEIRFAMISLRRQGKGTLETFADALADGAGRLRRSRNDI